MLAVSIDGFLLFWQPATSCLILLLFVANKFLLISSLTLYVRLWRRWACFCQSLTEINIAVQQLDELDREVKLFSHVGGGHYVSVTSSFQCVDFRKWFQPQDQKDPKPTRKGIALNLDQWVRMRLIVEAINNDHPVLATALPC